MIDVVRDREGVRKALEAIFEEDFVRTRIERTGAGANEESRERMEWQIPLRTLSPGYYRWCEHLLRLEAERDGGVALNPTSLAPFEVDGLLDLSRERAAFRHRHPPCSDCGAHQEGRFAPSCCICGVKFKRKE